jgi:uncharacterized membrane protein
MTTELHRRLNAFESELDAMHRELGRLRAMAEGFDPVTSAPEAAPAPASWVIRQPHAQPMPAPVSVPAAAPRHEPRPPSPRRLEMPELDFSAWLGARALALTGGAVTVLGVVFFFVLAVDRGWIGPTARVSLGATASALLFGAGVWARRRYGDTDAAVAAAGAGIAGGYATLLFAAAKYELLPDLAALGVAAAIAAVGTAAAIAWRAQILAGLGLIGAMAVPFATALDYPNDLTNLGTAFAALVLVATAVVALRERWLVLLGSAGAVGLLQIGGLVAQTDTADHVVVALATTYWLIALGIAAAAQWRSREALDRLPASFVTVGTAFAGLSAASLLEADTLGYALIVVGGVELGLGVACSIRRRLPELGALLGVAGLTVGAVACGVLLAGATLALAWAAEAAVLAWLAPRVREPRLLLMSLAFFIAAAFHALFVDAPASQLYDVTSDPASGALAVVAVAIAAAAVAATARVWPGEPRESEGVLAFLDGPAGEFAAVHSKRRIAGSWTAGVLAFYAAALGILGLFVHERRSTSICEAWAWGHVAVRALAIGLALAFVLAWPYTRIGRHLLLASYGLVVAAIATAVAFDLDRLDSPPRGWTVLITGLGTLAVILVNELRDGVGDELDWLPPVLAPVSLAGILAGCEWLSSGPAEGGNGSLVALGISAGYCALAALVFARGRRSFSTMLWAPALAVATVATINLLDDNVLVFAFSAAAAAIAGIGWRAGERRVTVAAAGLLALALAYVAALNAPPEDFFAASDSPATGVPAVLSLMGGAVALALTLEGPLRRWALGGAAVLGVYSVSLTILGAFEQFDGASVATSFQRGHTAVSAFWGVLGLVPLVVGLQRHSSVLRMAGFALFGISLAKLFLYDLGELSSITRAFSFLAVGGVLLVAGFVYQRLAADGNGERQLAAH